MSLDPSLSTEELQRLAANSPELHHEILQHPHCYPELAAWIRLNSSTYQSPTIAANTPSTSTADVSDSGSDQTAGYDPTSHTPAGRATATTAVATGKTKIILMTALAVVAVLTITVVAVFLTSSDPNDSAKKATKPASKEATNNADKKVDKNDLQSSDNKQEEPKNLQAIRKWDFKNSRLLVTRPGDSAPEEVQFVDGEYKVKPYDTTIFGDDAEPMVEFTLQTQYDQPIPEPVYGDLNGDGYEDAVLGVLWSAAPGGGNSYETNYYVFLWDPENNTVDQKLPHFFLESHMGFQVESVTYHDEQITITGLDNKFDKNWEEHSFSFNKETEEMNEV